MTDAHLLSRPQLPHSLDGRLPARTPSTTARPSRAWSRVLFSSFLAMGTACDEGFDEPLDQTELDPEDAARPSAADQLATTRRANAVDGYDVDISIQSEDVILEWVPPGGGHPVAVYRSEDPHALLMLDMDHPIPPGVDEFPLPYDATSFVDPGAASPFMPIPTYYYRVARTQPGGMGQVFDYSRMVMKTTTALHTGYSKLSMCMLDGPSAASEVDAMLGGFEAGIWGWDPAGQIYLHWQPEDGPGSPNDFAIEFGQTVSVQLEPGHHPFTHLVGVVPTYESFALSAEPGTHWMTVPPLYEGPDVASFWVDEVGYAGMGRWNNDTQDTTWYWGAGDPELTLEACQPYYTLLPDHACTSNDDCGSGFCSFVPEAACGEHAAGLCAPTPPDCEGVVPEPVCGCDGQTYASPCEAELAGVGINRMGECSACGVAFDFSLGDPSPLSGQSGDWQLAFEAPGSHDHPAVAFDSRVMGTDGNRAAPYPGDEAESSDVTVGPITLGAVLSFRSWHVDEGGSQYDRKSVIFESDTGQVTTLVDCYGGIDPQVFCEHRSDMRTGDDWDAIVLDTAALSGQTGSLRFEYDTVDSCCSFEQGWFIDDIGLGTCEPGSEPMPDPADDPCPAECQNLEMFQNLVLDPVPADPVVGCWVTDYGSGQSAGIATTTGDAGANHDDYGNGECWSYHVDGSYQSVVIDSAQALGCIELVQTQVNDLGLVCD